jgi:hypothetical protein
MLPFAAAELKSEGLANEIMQWASHREERQQGCAFSDDVLHGFSPVRVHEDMDGTIQKTLQPFQEIMTQPLFFDANSQSGDFIDFVVICRVSGLFLGTDEEYKLEYVVSASAVVELPTAC